MLKVRCLARLEEAGASVVDLGFMCFMVSGEEQERRPVLATVGFVDPYQDTYISTLILAVISGEGKAGQGMA